MRVREDYDKRGLAPALRRDFLTRNSERLALRRADKSRELYIDDVVIAAMEKGIIVNGTSVSDNACLDVGTPETHALVVARFDSLTAPKVAAKLEDK